MREEIEERETKLDPVEEEALASGS